MDADLTNRRPVSVLNSFPHLLRIGLPALFLAFFANGHADEPSARLLELEPGVGYKNVRMADGPWSIPVVRVDRSKPELRLESVHARGRAVGLSSLTDQVRLAEKAFGRPVAGVNGD